MTWDDVLRYDEVIKNTAQHWSKRIRVLDMEEDIRQHLYLVLFEKVDLTRANNEFEYVKAACWKIAHKFCTSKEMRQAKNTKSLNNCYQIDEEGEMVGYFPKFAKKVVNHPEWRSDWRSSLNDSTSRELNDESGNWL